MHAEAYLVPLVSLYLRELELCVCWVHCEYLFPSRCAEDLRERIVLPISLRDNKP
jgi:hypothetical protein